MFRRIFSVIFAAFIVCLVAHATPVVLTTATAATPADIGIAPRGQMVNVEYVHKKIADRWGITIDYSPKLDTAKRVANMEYLLILVDIANTRLNGEKTTNYAKGRFATKEVANVPVTDYAVDNLIRVKPKFWITTTPDTDSFKVRISAAGNFVIDWGDGTFDTISRTTATNTAGVYSHTYSAPGAYKIGFAGRATWYTFDSSVGAVSFYETNPTGEPDYVLNQLKIAGISGSIGAIFSTIGDGGTVTTQPRFNRLFSGAKNMVGEIPAELFAGIHGAPTYSMFSNTFSGCAGLTEIPDGLFPVFDGAPAQSMFYYTFADCTGLTTIPAGVFGAAVGAPADSMFDRTFSGCTGLTEIPGELFSGFKGAPATYMFYLTFHGCKKLAAIPDGLFAGVSGAPATYMFNGTFHGCKKLAAIPDGLFAGIQGRPADNMFEDTFRECTGLSGPIPANLFAGVVGAPAQSMFESTFDGCAGLTGEIPDGLFAGIQGRPAKNMFYETFNGCKGLTGPIPSALFGKLSGAPANSMFYRTFNKCAGLTGPIPSGLFGKLSGAPAPYMFRNTFYGCVGLTEIPGDLFGDISGDPASGMFYYTFAGCSGLTGDSAKIGDKYLYQIWDDVTEVQVGSCYEGARGLSDYANIPVIWK